MSKRTPNKELRVAIVQRLKNGGINAPIYTGHPKEGENTPFIIIPEMTSERDEMIPKGKRFFSVSVSISAVDFEETYERISSLMENVTEIITDSDDNDTFLPLNLENWDNIWTYVTSHRDALDNEIGTNTTVTYQMKFSSKE